MVTADGGQPDSSPLRAAVEASVAAMPVAARRDVDELAEEVRLAVRRWFRRNYGSRPVVVPYVVEL